MNYTLLRYICPFIVSFYSFLHAKERYSNTVQCIEETPLFIESLCLCKVLSKIIWTQMKMSWSGVTR